MNKAEVFEQLKIDEGVVYKIYKDHLGYHTFGVGHLIRESDPEYGLPVGTPVSKERVEECFDLDLEVAIEECKILFGSEEFDEFPEEVKQILVNMMFNLGRPRLAKFKNFRACLAAANWQGAADQMESSLWYKQVGKRAVRLVNRMRNV